MIDLPCGTLVIYEGHDIIHHTLSLRTSITKNDIGIVLSQVGAHCWVIFPANLAKHYITNGLLKKIC